MGAKKQTERSNAGIHTTGPLKETPWVWPDKRTFGYKSKKDMRRILLLRKWYSCSLCGRPSEVRPQAPLEDKIMSEMKFFPLRLCFFCASIQDTIRDLVKSVFKQDGN